MINNLSALSVPLIVQQYSQTMRKLLYFKFNRIFAITKSFFFIFLNRCQRNYFWNVVYDEFFLDSFLQNWSYLRRSFFSVYIICNLAHIFTVVEQSDKCLSSTNSRSEKLELQHFSILLNPWWISVSFLNIYIIDIYF